GFTRSSLGLVQRVRHLVAAHHGPFRGLLVAGLATPLPVGAVFVRFGLRRLRNSLRTHAVTHVSVAAQHSPLARTILLPVPGNGRHQRGTDVSQSLVRFEAGHNGKSGPIRTGFGSASARAKVDGYARPAWRTGPDQQETGWACILDRAPRYGL